MIAPEHQHQDTSGTVRRGAPLNNSSSMRHGLRATKLPPGCSYIAKESNRFRRDVEAAVIDVHGEMDIYRTALVNSAMKWEQVSRLASRWLAIDHDELAPDQRLKFAMDAAKASDNRDRCLRLLRLDEEPGADPWATIDSIPPATTETTGNGSEKPQAAQ